MARQKPRSWQLQEAKARLSEVVKKAMTEGPQEITLHGKPAVVVMDANELQKRSAKPLESENLVDFLMRSPLKGVKLDLRRSKDTRMRPIPLFNEED